MGFREICRWVLSLPCAMPRSPFRRLVLATLLLMTVWALLGPSGIGEELLSLSLPSLLPAPASPGPPLALPGYLIANEGVCRVPGAAPFLLILVCSALENLNQRNAIRESWGGLRQARGRRVQTLFLLGEPNSADPQAVSQKKLEEESSAHGDILQATFLDTYRNLTLKTLSGLNWADKHCPTAQYILKTDDDVFVNVPELVSELVWRGGTPGATGNGPGAPDGGWDWGAPVGQRPAPRGEPSPAPLVPGPGALVGVPHKVIREQVPGLRGAVASGPGRLPSLCLRHRLCPVCVRCPAGPQNGQQSPQSANGGCLCGSKCRSRRPHPNPLRQAGRCHSLPPRSVLLREVPADLSQVRPLDHAKSLEAGGWLWEGKQFFLLLLVPEGPGYCPVPVHSLASQLSA